MKFECGDLERALAISDLMPEAREHLKICATCRREYRLWTEISSTARELHEEWESADLWPRIQRAMEAEPKPKKPWWSGPKTWMIGAAVAATLAAAVLLPLRFWRTPAQPSAVAVVQPEASGSTEQDFLTDQALHEVEKSEAAYRQSIDKLSHLAQSKLNKAASPNVVNVREKLLLLDSAIADTRANVASNRFNVRLQTTLADLYRQKQQTLEELVARDRKN